MAGYEGFPFTATQADKEEEEAFTVKARAEKELAFVKAKAEEASFIVKAKRKAEEEAAFTVKAKAPPAVVVREGADTTTDSKEYPSDDYDSDDDPETCYAKFKARFERRVQANKARYPSLVGLPRIVGKVEHSLHSHEDGDGAVVDAAVLVREAEIIALVG